MAYSTIIFTIDGPVATLSFNRPEKLNAVTPEMRPSISSPRWRSMNSTFFSAMESRSASSAASSAGGPGRPRSRRCVHTRGSVLTSGLTPEFPS